MSNNQNQAPVEDAVRQPAPMEVDVRIHNLRTEGPALATASVALNGCFAVRGVKVMRGKDGPFVSMPSYHGAGGYRDICFPCTSSAQAPYPSLPDFARKLTHFAAPPLHGRPAALGSAVIAVGA